MRFILAFLLAASATAQPVTETVDVHVLEIEAVVIDKQGKPVEGLTKDDFVVQIGSRPAEIANFYVVKPLPAGEAALQAHGGADTRLVIFIDDLHLRRRGKKRAIDALRAHLDKFDPKATAMLVVWNGSMNVRVPATNDRAVLLRALEAIDREPPLGTRYDGERRAMLRTIDTVAEKMTSARQGPPTAASKFGVENESERPEILGQKVMTFAETYSRETQNTLEALREAVSTLKGLDGRKVLLYISEGLPLQPAGEVIEYWSRLMRDGRLQQPAEEPMDEYLKTFSGRASEAMRFDQTSRFVELVRDAQAARVMFSAIEPAGSGGFDDAGLMDEGRSKPARVDSSLSRHNQRSAMQMVAEETGGRYFADENDLEVVMDALAGHVSTYYSLAVRAPQQRDVAVRVGVRNRKDVRVLTSRRRSSALQEEAVNAAVRARLYSREAVNPLEANVQFGAAWPDSRRCRVPVQIIIPAGKLTAGPDGKAEFSVRAMVLDSKQRESKIQHMVRKIVPQPDAAVTESIAFGLQPSRYIVSLAILDHVTGETSYIQTEIDTSVCGS
ncbi:MAG TPA: VWA domain-containing protein [Thermoanaerobaculia bacterium]|jgi:VWFA-related protein